MKSLKRHFCWELVFWRKIVWWRGEGDWVLILTWNLLPLLVLWVAFCCKCGPKNKFSADFPGIFKRAIPPKMVPESLPQNAQKFGFRNYRAICAEYLSWQFFRDVNLVVLYIRSTSSSSLEQWPVEAGYLLCVGDYYYSVLQGLPQYKDPFTKQSGFQCQPRGFVCSRRTVFQSSQLG